MDQSYKNLNMREPAIFRICIQGELDKSWFDYFGAKSVSVEQIDNEQIVTVIISEPMDQSALIGFINHLNDLGIPLISVDPLRKN